MFALFAFLSLLIELAIGYPDRLYRLIGHPVTWIGRLIGGLDRTLNRETDTPERRKLMGLACLAVVLILSGVTAFALQQMLGGWVGLILTAVLGSALMAQRSLGTHVAAVAVALESGGLEAGRKAVSQIVGRDPQSLDEAGIARAAIESLAENASDGVIAPALWLALGGLPGAALYKAANTADSMIGHRTARHKDFGWAAARFDDLINLPASRLTALLFVLAATLVPGTSAVNAWRAVRRDAGHHRSPNAGWPEAAMAGALGLALAGPRHYGGELVEDALMGKGGRREAGAADIRRALRLYWTADLLLIVLAGLAAFALHG